ncbi:LacI family transcriptional regulator [Thermosporothrix hazakensis]|jgi:LacI family transcriptional regulator|uniref:LacI family transcriptional regulator n=2 Tax=Thermosporothrix TaxID=768650 RepID=A0A326U7X0_THEHA|nr:LacI family DNA-binding transcriptional regulator [Thermosporothrix hazakensis]PZW29379.1 LacI family transcriptional regulator [Thermosporothrix hazakensis]BBH85664.1 transcriptional regulator [Thermosporothrix sp. COM3]GCE45907.1 transcriptional regulator [Thermosporothrix hazakensis]
MTTIYDIAKAVGVTQTTVANALAGRHNVSEATRQRILQCAREMGYRPNVLARGLARRKTFSLGFLLPTIANPFYPEIAEEVERVAQQHDYQMLLCNTHYDPALGQQHLERLVSRWVDGLLIMGSSLDITCILPHFQQGLPVVLCDWQENEKPPAVLPQVSTDFRLAGALAARHLLELGHRSIAVIVEEPRHALRLAGFRDTLHEAGLLLELIQQGYSTVESGYAAAKELLARPDRPTAIFTTSDWMALGAMNAIREAGLSIPHDISLLGLDNIQLSAHLHPPLTTIALPKHALARTATELLLRQIEGKQEQSDPILLPPALLVRASTACPSR